MRQISAIYNIFNHHTKHSGYFQFVRYIYDITHHITPIKILPMTFVNLLPNPFVTCSGMRWYEKRMFFDELVLMIDWFFHSNKIYHFLYGEMAYRYLGNLKRYIPHNNKIICTFHQPSKIFEEIVKDIRHIQFIDAIIVLSKEQLAYFKNIINPDKVFFIPHGIDTEYFRPKENKPKNNVFSCLTIGHWLRDFEMLSKVIKILNTTNMNFIFNIVSSNEGNKYFEDIPNVNLRLQITDKELLFLYQDADILVLPLIDSTANNTLLEGLACGLPIVTTDVGGVKDYVNDSCAVLIPKGNAEMMAEEVIKLVNDKVRLHQMAQNSRKRALELSWDKIAEQIESVYQKVAKG